MSEELLFSFEEIMKPELNCQITCMVQSPVVDVIGIGFDSGKIYIINLLYNELLI